MYFLLSGCHGAGDLRCQLKEGISIYLRHDRFRDCGHRIRGSNVMANSIGVGGIPGILSIQPQYMGRFAVCMLITMVVPFVLTVVVGKKKDVR